MTQTAPALPWVTWLSAKTHRVNVMFPGTATSTYSPAFLFTAPVSGSTGGTSRFSVRSAFAVNKILRHQSDCPYETKIKKNVPIITAPPAADGSSPAAGKYRPSLNCTSVKSPRASPSMNMNAPSRPPPLRRRRFLMIKLPSLFTTKSVARATSISQCPSVVYAHCGPARRVTSLETGYPTTGHRNGSTRVWPSPVISPASNVSS